MHKRGPRSLLGQGMSFGNVTRFQNNLKHILENKKPRVCCTLFGPIMFNQAVFFSWISVAPSIQ